MTHEQQLAEQVQHRLWMAYPGFTLAEAKLEAANRLHRAQQHSRENRFNFEKRLIGSDQYYYLQDHIERDIDEATYDLQLFSRADGVAK